PRAHPDPRRAAPAREAPRLPRTHGGEGGRRSHAGRDQRAGALGHGLPRPSGGRARAGRDAAARPDPPDRAPGGPPARRRGSATGLSRRAQGARHDRARASSVGGHPVRRVLLVLVLAAPAAAHDRSTSYSTWDIHGRRAHVVVRTTALEASHYPWGVGSDRRT